jgi:hypothetical protein
MTCWALIPHHRMQDIVPMLQAKQQLQCIPATVSAPADIHKKSASPPGRSFTKSTTGSGAAVATKALTENFTGNTFEAGDANEVDQFFNSDGATAAGKSGAEDNTNTMIPVREYNSVSTTEELTASLREQSLTQFTNSLERNGKLAASSMLAMTDDEEVVVQQLNIMTPIDSTRPSISDNNNNSSGKKKISPTAARGNTSPSSRGDRSESPKNMNISTRSDRHMYTHAPMSNQGSLRTPMRSRADSNNNLLLTTESNSPEKDAQLICNNLKGELARPPPSLRDNSVYSSIMNNMDIPMDDNMDDNIDVAHYFIDERGEAIRKLDKAFKSSKSVQSFGFGFEGFLSQSNKLNTASTGDGDPFTDSIKTNPSNNNSLNNTQNNPLNTSTKSVNNGQLVNTHQQHAGDWAELDLLRSSNISDAELNAMSPFKREQLRQQEVSRIGSVAVTAAERIRMAKKHNDAVLADREQAVKSRKSRQHRRKEHASSAAAAH